VSVEVRSKEFVLSILIFITTVIAGAFFVLWRGARRRWKELADEVEVLKTRLEGEQTANADIVFELNTTKVELDNLKRRFLN
jgi:hypothetical protein